MSANSDGHALLLSDDLIFTSRVTGTARGAKLDVKPARTMDALLALAAQQSPSCIIVDLANPQLDVPVLVRRLREMCPVMPRLVAYGSHINAAELRAAREAGCDVVLPRSKFVEELPLRIAEWLAVGNSTPQVAKTAEGGPSTEGGADHFSPRP